MKTITSTKLSARAALNQVIRYSATINTLATQERDKGFYKHRMAQIRGLMDKISKAGHEYSAYMNVLETD